MVLEMMGEAGNKRFVLQLTSIGQRPTPNFGHIRRLAQNGEIRHTQGSHANGPKRSGPFGWHVIRGGASPRGPIAVSLHSMGGLAWYVVCRALLSFFLFTKMDETETERAFA